VPFLVDTRLPEQRVSVSANGQPVGEWVWQARTLPGRELLIPKNLLAGGALRLEFHIAHPASPAEFGLSPDPNKYGITISSIRLHPEVRTNYQWGDTISLLANRHPIDTAAISGFSPFSTEGAYTVGPVAVVRLSVPPAAQDMVLEVDAAAFIVDTRLPEQRVSVSANGHAVGEWIWKAGTLPSHELVISKDLLREGKLRLEFHVARPASPAEFGINSDPNKYGIRITSIRLHPAG
jgi:hypothetical protein